jgi:phenylacetate-CoA ligase
MSSIKGRADDMLIIRGVNLFYTQVEEVIHQMESLSPNYRLIVEKKGSMDSVKVEVETAPGVDHTNAVLSNQLKLKIKGSIGLSMGVEIKSPNSIPRSQGGKLSRILDKR